MSMHTAKIDQARLETRVALYRRAVATSSGASALLAVVLVAQVWRPELSARIFAGLAILLGVLALRFALGRLHSRARADAAGTWLIRYRAGALVHGIAWASLSGLLIPRLSPPEIEILLYAESALCAGALVTMSFDLAGALAFVIPVGLPLAVHLSQHDISRPTGVLLIALVLLSLALLSAIRSWRGLAHELDVRIEQSERADEARQAAQVAESARRELAEKRHLLELLMQTSRQGFWFVDRDGITVDLNEAMCRLLGRPREQILGRAAVEFFEGADLATMRQELERRRQGASGSYEAAIRRPDGTTVYCANSATPILGEAGQRTGSVGIWSDITEKRQQEAVLATYRNAVNSIIDMVSVVDDRVVYRLVNDAWCRSIGLERDAALGHAATEIMPWALSEERDEAFRACLALGQSRSIVSRTETPGGTPRYFETTYHPYIDEAGSGRQIVIVTRNVTEKEQSRRQLEIAAEYLRRTLNATGDAIFASESDDMAAPVLFANEQVLQMWGIPPEKSSTLTSADIMAYATPLFVDADAETERIRRIIDSNVQSETRVQLRDGRVLLRRCIPARVDDHTLRVWSFSDVTDQERALQILRASESEQRALLDAFPGFIVAIDERSRYAYVNRRFATLLNRMPSDLVGQPLSDTTGQEQLGPMAHAIQQAWLGSKPVIELRYPPRDGQPGIDMEMTLVAGHSQVAASTICYGFGVDITARKTAEQALVIARDQAQHASLAKSQFLSQMSHELRTPLNAVLGLGQLLASDAQHPLPPHQQRYVAGMLRGGRHLLELIGDVLDLGRVELGRLEVVSAEVSLRDVVDGCLNLMRPLAEEKQVHLPRDAAVTQGLRVLADRTRLKQVILNLLGNAIKYNKVGGTVTVECVREGATARIGIRDTGDGVTVEDQARLFQPFERLGAARSGIEGAGIGLALSRQLVEAMGGSMGVESAPGTGSLFWFRLPRVGTSQGQQIMPTSDPEAAEPLHERTGQAGFPARTVLYIEDNPVNVFVMEAMFEQLSGLRLLTALLPSAGLEMARSERPDLILLDVQLPEMSGAQVLARLRENNDTRDIPVIAVSADAMPESIHALLAGGALSYITKPFDLDQLRSAMHRAFGSAVRSAGRAEP